MKGVVFNILEDFIVENWGEHAYEDILEAAKPSCPFFVGPDTYPDDDLFKLVGAACDKHGIPLREAVRRFGEYAFPRLAAKYPVFLENQTDLKSFLYSVDRIIHVEVRKIMDGAATPSFEFEDPGGGRLVVRYRSRRKLCAFMEGLLVAAADHFGQSVAFDHGPCMHDGHDHCRFALDIDAVQRVAS